MNKEKPASTFSVPQLRTMLGLSKTESYWLVHKNLFDTITVNGSMRIVTASFEAWYEHQTHYRKVDGPEPGASLLKEFYTVKQISEKLGLSPSAIYDLVRREGLPFTMNSATNAWLIPVKAFELWFASQAHYKETESYKKNKKLRKESISLFEFGRTLGIDKNMTASVLNELSPHLDIFEISGHKRITKQSLKVQQRIFHRNQIVFTETASAIQSRGGD